MTTVCNCALFDDDLIDQGWTCCNCYNDRKDNPEGVSLAEAK